jgi:hypothetical protein
MWAGVRFGEFQAPYFGLGECAQAAWEGSKKM